MKSENMLNKHPYKSVKKLIKPAMDVWRVGDPRCVICGEYAPKTKEHAPPKAIFPKKPSDLITVPACEKCQKSEDEGFRDFIAYNCVRKPTKSSIELLEKINSTLIYRSPRKEYMEQFFNKAEKRLEFEQDKVTNEIQPKIKVIWSKELFDPIILKIAHAYHWLLNEGSVLVDEKGKLLLIHDYDPSSDLGGQITGQSYPSVNIGDGQFILTLIRGFEEAPFDTTFCMGLHFHTDDDVRKGYSVQVFFLLDKYEGVNPLSSSIIQSLIDGSSDSSIYDLSIPLYKRYPEYLRL